MSCSSVADPGNPPTPGSANAAVLGDDCTTNAQCDGAAGEICCGGLCLSRTSDNNCGTCGNVCPGSTTCLENATCGCVDPMTRCGNSCVDTMINKNHCGACNAACPGGSTCEGGACACADPALTACGNACVNVLSNNTHCGACNTACAGATTCLGGACGCANPAHTQCGNSCVDITTSNTNCGDCGITCSGATTCLGGACGCANPALTQCGNACINVLTDNANCGACGTVCAAGQTCQAGECHVQCAPGKTNCNEVCVDLTWSPNHCGACDSPCDPGDPADPANFPPYVCGNSVCALTCPAGQTSCNRSCRNLQTDNTSCGTCGNVCAAGTTCTGGVCQSPHKVSCNAIKQATPASPSGVYTIDPDGAGAIAPFPVYCDMTTNGGGWTLIIKVNGASGTFNYNSSFWTNSATHNPGATAFDQTEAKFQSFSTVPFTNVLVGMRDSGTVRYVTLTKSASSMQTLLSGGFNGTGVGRNAWKGLMASGSLQPNCNREGFNVDCGGSDTRVRIGILSNQENDCNSCDSRIGVGAIGTYCGQDGSNTAGNEATCGADAGDRHTKGFGYVFVR